MTYWDSIKKRVQELELVLAQDASLDRVKRVELGRELGQLRALLVKHKLVETLSHEHQNAVDAAEHEHDPAMKALLEDEAATLLEQVKHGNAELEKLLAIPDPYADRSVFLEIRAGTGGQEAALFVADLLKMYTNYAHRMHWQVSLDSFSTTDLGGYREVVLHIKGDEVYGHLKFESGVHRVQRVPATETQGRVHTSTATVAVLPEAEEVDVVINPADLRIDVFRSSGAGGQHVNTTDSAVRITHLPTGTVVSCQDERSQHKNKTKALKILQSRVLAAQIEQHHIERAKQRKEMVGSGMRSEKIRTYNFPQNRITDHQVELTLKNLDMVMLGGDLDPIIDALREQEHQKNKQFFLAQFAYKAVEK